MSTKIVVKALRYRLQPSEEQTTRFRQISGCRRWLWNYALEHKIQHYQHTGQSLSRYDLQKHQPVLKRQPETAWLKECDSQALQVVLGDLDRAFTHFLEGRARFPKFKSLRNTPPAFGIPQRVRVEGSKVYVPKVGWVEIRLHRPLEGSVKGARFKAEPDGHWYVSFTCHILMPVDPSPPTQNLVGVDVGLDEFVVTSDGDKTAAPRFYRRSQNKIKRAQRKVSRKLQPGQKQQSRNYGKAKKKVAVVHSQVRHQRDDFLHKSSLSLVVAHDGVSIEDLAVSALTRTKLRGHSKSWYDTAASTFRRFLIYKSDWRNKPLILVDRWFPSSKRCSNPDCHYLHSDLTLREHSWTCPKCGSVHNRNRNAAINLRDEGYRLLTEGRSAGKSVEEVSASRQRAVSVEAENQLCEEGSPRL